MLARLDFEPEQFFERPFLVPFRKLGFNSTIAIMNHVMYKLRPSSFITQLCSLISEKVKSVRHPCCWRGFMPTFAERFRVYPAHKFASKIAKSKCVCIMGARASERYQTAIVVCARGE